ncbi:hypothetical protein OAG47_01720 [Verrucomicrobiales bacterium]|jgi:hypothetical protein|nr:hypothetical protein [Verrucomicrobiales bacterium]|tara:strand:+ start:300 stop:488 length:189 start_codon:yes stop_codon:yes gene_type:complete
MKLSAYEKERLAHINYKMGVIHDFVDDIYELLVDRDFDELSDVLVELIEELREIQLSITDEL